MAIQVLPTKFAESKIYIPDVHEDDRGFFKETFSTAKYAAVGLHDTFVQDSVSFSEKNTIRGLHYDRRMAKFVQVLRGRIFDAIVDFRPDSPTYLQWQGFILSEHNHRQLYVPAGFLHGFLALTDDVVFSYKHSALYDPTTDGAIRWNDPKIGIEWPIVGEPRVSRKDREAPLVS